MYLSRNSCFWWVGNHQKVGDSGGGCAKRRTGDLGGCATAIDDGLQGGRALQATVSCGGCATALNDGLQGGVDYQQQRAAVGVEHQ